VIPSLMVLAETVGNTDLFEMMVAGKSRLTENQENIVGAYHELLDRLEAGAIYDREMTGELLAVLDILDRSCGRIRCEQWLFGEDWKIDVEAVVRNMKARVVRFGLVDGESDE
jgi:hypothetical protein